MSLRTLTATRVKRRFRGGSSSPVLVDTQEGQFVAKLRGAGQGLPALVAEILVAELAERLGLPVPERRLIELAPNTPSDDRNDELADLLGASAGLNLGMRYLDGARDASPQQIAAIDDEFALRVLWLDGLCMNPDRTPQNPNILFWNQRPWLIDHGAALPFQYDWAALDEDTPREVPFYAGHLFRDRLGSLARFDAQLAGRLTRAALDAAVGVIPDEFALGTTGEQPERARAAYHAVLWKRLKPPRPFVEEATESA